MGLPSIFNKKSGTLFTWPVIISFTLLAIIILGTLIAPILTPYDPDKLDLSQSLQPPSLQHLLGTDKTGRDLFSRLLFGGQTTLLSALIVVLISIAIGVPFGLLTGYFEGKLDAFIMRLWDIIMAFPALLMAFIFVATFGRGIVTCVIALGIYFIPMISRLTRSLTMTEKHKAYVESARSLGFSHLRILFRHILPNCVSIMLAELTLDIAYAILSLSAMSFLGLGVQPPTSDWGAMLEEGREFLQSSPLLALAPGLTIMITVVSLNVLSDSLQMYFDPKQRRLPSFKKMRKLAGVTNG